MLPYAVQHVTVQNDGTQVQQTTFDYPFFYTILFFSFFPNICQDFLACSSYTSFNSEADICW